jgi:hypothetical protein
LSPCALGDSFKHGLPFRGMGCGAGDQRRYHIPRSAAHPARNSRETSIRNA